MRFLFGAVVLSGWVSAHAWAESARVSALVEKALSSHPELRFYEAEVEAAKGGVKTAGAIKNPDLQTRGRSLAGEGFGKSCAVGWADVVGDTYTDH
jgi:outer membrane protein TolC